MANFYVDIHVLQTVPPSCVNRDDTGSPKTAVYGGVTRARVSSQCWKNAVRSMFRDILPKEDVGLRTKHLIDVISKEMRHIDSSFTEKESIKLAGDALKVIGKDGIKVEKEKTEDSAQKNSALFFISPAQINKVASILVSHPDVKKVKGDIHDALDKEPSIDIALFGRMVADDPSLNTDASCQVAHSISTHKVSNEYDYFTAQDDCSPADNAGAGMLGTVEYNSSTLYRYATVAVHALKENLKDDTAKAVKTFVDAFIRSMPTGKLNTFANRTMPDAVMVTIRTDQPVNLVGAFERPVKSSDNGYIEASCIKLAEHAKDTYSKWLDDPVACFVISHNDKLNALGESVSLKEMLNKLEAELTNRLS